MSDTAGYPAATVASGGTATDDLPDPNPPLTDAEKAEVEAMYAKMKDEAKASGHQWLMARTPARYQKAMKAHADADFPPPPPPPPTSSGTAPPVTS
jgi:hypothetical protein